VNNAQTANKTQPHYEQMWPDLRVLYKGDVER